jgi:hypothetical protein
MRARFEDAGTYHYLLNGVPADIHESWRRRQQAAGEWWVSSSRRAGGVEIAVEASVVDGLVTGFVVAWQSKSDELRADYTLLANRVRIERSRNGTPAESMDIPFRNDMPAPLLSPLMRIFAGPLIAELLGRDGAGHVVVPSIVDPASPEKLLSPLLSERSARLVEANVLLDSDGVSRQCRLCEYHGDQYGPGTEFWLGDDNLLLRYQWQQSSRQQWDVWLRRGEGVSQ